jgi:repressor LexA
MGGDFTDKQGQYLAFIHHYTLIHGRSPAESDMARFFRTSPPTAHQMILRLAEKGFIERVPGAPRSMRLLISEEDLPRLKRPDAT